MANHLIDENSMTAIAEAIRAKTGSTSKLKPADMASAIEGIETSAGGDTLTEFLKVRDGNNLFYKCYNLTTIPEMDTSSFTTMASMFEHSSSIKTIPEMDTSSVTDMSSMFHSCTSLTNIPEMDTSSVRLMSYMFNSCSSLTNIPEMDTSSVTTMASMFGYCSKLKTIPKMDTSSVTDMSSMFRSCSSLTNIPEMDTSSVTTMTSMFNSCSSLTDLTLKNIKANLTVSSGTSWGHLLTLDSLIGLIYELRDTGSSKTLTVGLANLEKLANVYVKTIDITDEMRDEDDLIDEKLPFVVCESTDEGATLITEYVVLKHWQLK